MRVYGVGESIAKEGAGVDLIQRFADKVAEGDKRSLAERAAERLAALRKNDDADPAATLPASSVRGDDVSVPTDRDGSGTDELALDSGEAPPSEKQNDGNLDRSSILTAAGRRPESSEETEPPHAGRNSTGLAVDNPDLAPIIHDGHRISAGRAVATGLTAIFETDCRRGWRLLFGARPAAPAAWFRALGR